MSALALVWALSAQPIGPVVLPWAGGRVITTAHVHVGVRPAAFVDNEGAHSAREYGAGGTVQITVNWLP